MKPSVRGSFVSAAALVVLLMLAPGAASTAMAATDSGLKVDWHRAQSSGLGAPDRLPAGAYAHGTYVVSSFPMTKSGTRIWASSDALHWKLVWVGAANVTSIVAGGPGFVAWADGIMISENGRGWLPQTYKIPHGLAFADFATLGSVDGAVVAFTSSGRDYWSLDGRHWHASAHAPAKPLAVAGDGAHLWALTGGRNFDTQVSKPIEVWVTDDGRTWAKTGQLPNSHRVSGVTAAFGPQGGVAIAGAKAWYSSDDVHWRVAKNTPTITKKGRDFVDAAIGDASGFIITAHRDPPGCVYDPASRRALTWTSVDGRIWREMPAKGFLGTEIDQLFISGRTLIGVGADFDPDPGSGAVWHAQLPIIASDTAPPPAPISKPGRVGC